MTSAINSSKASRRDEATEGGNQKFPRSEDIARILSDGPALHKQEVDLARLGYTVDVRIEDEKGYGRVCAVTT